jgi:hypothetical protein
VPTDIRSERPLDRSLQRYSYTSLLGLSSHGVDYEEKKIEGKAIPVTGREGP